MVLIMLALSRCECSANLSISVSQPCGLIEPFDSGQALHLLRGVAESVSGEPEPGADGAADDATNSPQDAASAGAL